MRRATVVLAVLLVPFFGCTSTPACSCEPCDAGECGSGLEWVAVDAGAVDAGAVDAGAVDAGAVDAGVCVTGSLDRDVPAFACTAGLQFATVCMSGFGYGCEDGCWSGFLDGECGGRLGLPDGGTSGPVIASAPTSPCGAGELGSIACVAAAEGYTCTASGWSPFLGGPCP